LSSELAVEMLLVALSPQALKSTESTAAHSPEIGKYRIVEARPVSSEGAF
jgi:hypothetical protein